MANAKNHLGMARKPCCDVGKCGYSLFMGRRLNEDIAIYSNAPAELKNLVDDLHEAGFRYSVAEEKTIVANKRNKRMQETLEALEKELHVSDNAIYRWLKATRLNGLKAAGPSIVGLAWRLQLRDQAYGEDRWGRSFLLALDYGETEADQDLREEARKLRRPDPLQAVQVGGHLFSRSTRVFVAQDYEQRISSAIREQNNSYFVVSGSKASGKSTIIRSVLLNMPRRLFSRAVYLDVARLKRANEAENREGNALVRAIRFLARGLELHSLGDVGDDILADQFIRVLEQGERALFVIDNLVEYEDSEIVGYFSARMPANVKTIFGIELSSISRGLMDAGLANVIHIDRLSYGEAFQLMEAEVRQSSRSEAPPFPADTAKEIHEACAGNPALMILMARLSGHASSIADLLAMVGDSPDFDGKLNALLRRWWSELDADECRIALTSLRFPGTFTRDDIRRLSGLVKDKFFDDFKRVSPILFQDELRIGGSREQSFSLHDSTRAFLRSMVASSPGGEQLDSIEEKVRIARFAADTLARNCPDPYDIVKARELEPMEDFIFGALELCRKYGLASVGEVPDEVRKEMSRAGLDIIAGVGFSLYRRGLWNQFRDLHSNGARFAAVLNDHQRVIYETALDLNWKLRIGLKEQVRSIAAILKSYLNSGLTALASFEDKVQVEVQRSLAAYDYYEHYFWDPLHSIGDSRARLETMMADWQNLNPQSRYSIAKWLARIMLREGDVQGALSILTKAHSSSIRQSTNRHAEITTRVELARAYLATEDSKTSRAEAKKHLDRASGLLRQFPCIEREAEVKRWVGWLNYAKGDVGAAGRYLRRAKELYSQLGDSFHADRLSHDLECVEKGKPLWRTLLKP